VAPTARAPTPPPRLGGVGLFWRTFILLALLILCSTVAWLHVFRTQEYEPRVLRNAHQIATVVNLTRNALIHMDAITRVPLLKALSDEEDLTLVVREPSDDVRPFGETELEMRLAQALVERLGEGTVVASSVNDEPGLWVGFEIDRDSYWLQMDASRLQPLGNESWLQWLALSGLLSVLGAMAITAFVNRPLKKLQRAVRRVREGQYRETTLDERVSTPEIRAVNIGFNRMAERLATVEEERQLMLAGISHDLRTPLARLRLEAELSVPDLTARQAMAADIDQLDQIIDTFLGYARRENTRLEPVPLAAMVSRSISPFGASSRMAITVDIPEDLQVQADPVALLRVLSNLLENARRHGQSPGDGISRVHLQAQAQGPQVTLTVRDQGPGVAEEALERLTQPFYRADTARTTAGSGLGLAIVERAIERMGGQLQLRNAAGGGFEVQISLPSA